MAKSYKKKNGELEVTDTNTVTTVSTYTLEFLQGQRVYVVADIGRLQAELDNIDELITQATNLGI